MTGPAAPSFAGRIARSFVVMSGVNAVARAVNAIAIIAAARFIATDEFGVFTIVSAFIVVLRAITELSLGEALVQARSPTRRNIDTLFWLALGLSGTLYGLVYVFAPVVAWIYDIPELAPLLRANGLVVLPFALFVIPRALLERDLGFKRLSAVDNIPLFLMAGTLITLAARGHGVWSFVWAELVLRGSQMVIAQATRPYLPRSRPRPGDVRGVRSLIDFGVFASGSRILYNLYTHADYFIVGYMFSKEMAGIYGFAYRVISDPARQLAMSINRVAFPAFARLQNERDRLRRYYYTISRVTLSVVGVAVVALAIYMEAVLDALGYDQWLPAVPYVRVFAIMALIQVVAPLVPQLLNAVGRARQNFLYSLACALVLPPAFAIGAQFGLMGVVVAWVVGYPVVVAILFWFGADVLETPMTSMLRKAFAGLAVVVPVTGAAVVIERLMTGALGASAAVTASAGLAATLAVGLGIVWVRERETLRHLRS